MPLAGNSILPLPTIRVTPVSNIPTNECANCNYCELIDIVISSCNSPARRNWSRGRSFLLFSLLRTINRTRHSSIAFSRVWWPIYISRISMAAFKEAQAIAVSIVRYDCDSSLSIAVARGFPMRVHFIQDTICTSIAAGTFSVTLTF